MHDSSDERGMMLDRRCLRGDLHVHTLASDGAASLVAMASAASNAGLQYIAITDHSQHFVHARGLDADALARQSDEIDALNAVLEGFTVLKGVEVDIRVDGTLALPDAVLEKLDVVVASVHDHFDLRAREQTERLLRALDRPFVTLLGHPTARLIGERAGIACDWPRVFEQVRSRGVYLEANSQPKRLDLNHAMIREASALGILVSIDSDAHSVHAFAHLEGGVQQAQRAGLLVSQALNACSLPELRERLRALRLR